LSSHIKKVLIVTGGSRGIGAATAKLAAAHGYAVCVNYLHNQQAAEAVVAEIQTTGGKALAMQADLSVEAQIVALFERVDQELGPVTALVNNAGILEKQSGLLDMDQDRLQRIFAANAIGPMLCAREAVKRMSAKLGGKGGAIVNVSSAAARLGAAGEYIDYAASKGALDTFTIGLSKEVAEQGIRVNSVRPGFIYTDIHASGGEPGRVDRVKDSIPMKRGGQPEEVAQAILWLLSEQASYATGTFIDLAGGR
jgi:NAD(P)-dependent dehydrogenase (short-subunit alcohol dehydrogenase family)